MLLPDSAALVTGGAVRVGRAISLGLAREGMRVVVHYGRSSGEAAAVVNEIREGGGEAVAVGADLSRLSEVERLVDEAETAFGGVDVLVNNASVFPAERIGEVDEALWDGTMAVNLKAPFFLTQALGGRMKKRGEGVVVNLADLAGLQAWSNYAVHSIAKAALVQLTKVAARSLAPEVRVVAIAPGTVLPPVDLPRDELERLEKLTPLKRSGTPDDVVQAVLYLIRASFVTGEVLVLDGGRILSG